MKLKHWLVSVTITATLTVFCFFQFTPHILMLSFKTKAQMNDQIGKLTISPRAEAGKDEIVRMSPDLLYSSCVFDLSKGAYRITSPPADDYMSVSFFAHNSDNFFAINDKQSPEGFDLVLVKSGQILSVPDGATLVETDTPYGIILLRYYLGNKSLASLDTFRQQATCDLIELDN